MEELTDYEKSLYEIELAEQEQEQDEYLYKLYFNEPIFTFNEHSNIINEEIIDY